jgi:hypothetical protein
VMLLDKGCGSCCRLSIRSLHHRQLCLQTRHLLANMIPKKKRRLVLVFEQNRRPAPAWTC